MALHLNTAPQNNPLQSPPPIQSSLFLALSPFLSISLSCCQSPAFTISLSLFVTISPTPSLSASLSTKILLSLSLSPYFHLFSFPLSLFPLSLLAIYFPSSTLSLPFLNPLSLLFVYRRSPSLHTHSPHLLTASPLYHYFLLFCSLPF